VRSTINRLFGNPSNAAKRSPSPPVAQMSERDFQIQIGIVLDALGAILSAYGKHAIETESETPEARQRILHQWMLHATLGGPHPDRDASQPVGGILARDWRGLVRHFGNIRRDEVENVQRTSRDLRDGIWAFIGALHRVVVAEHEETRVFTEAFERLRMAAEDGSSEELKTEAFAIAATLDTLVQSRARRQQDQYKALTAQLRIATQELEDARRLSTLDALTGLPNRKGFDDYVARTIELHALLQQPTCLLVIDIDEFKSVNDSLGHQLGDEALRTLATALSRTFLRKTDFICRFAGDEFAVVLQETTLATGVTSAERLRRNLREQLAGRPEDAPRIDYSVSIGVAPLLIGDTAATWFERADKSLYMAKATGRDRVVAD
jgi:diguanylate cyclase (GGDEF)-like protein